MTSPHLHTQPLHYDSLRRVSLPWRYLHPTVACQVCDVTGGAGRTGARPLEACHLLTSVLIWYWSVSNTPVSYRLKRSENVTEILAALHAPLFSTPLLPPSYQHTRFSERLLLCPTTTVTWSVQRHGCTFRYRWVTNVTVHLGSDDIPSSAALGLHASGCYLGGVGSGWVVVEVKRESPFQGSTELKSWPTNDNLVGYVTLGERFLNVERALMMVISITSYVNRQLLNAVSVIR